MTTVSIDEAIIYYVRGKNPSVEVDFMPIMGNVNLQGDGNGNIAIVKWDIPNVSQPTREELDAITPEMITQSKLQKYQTDYSTVKQTLPQRYPQFALVYITMRNLAKKLNLTDAEWETLCEESWTEWSQTQI